jgi:hypothetical protein
MNVLRFTRLTLTVVYFFALLPVTFLGWVAYSDYDYRGCPGEAISQCSDAATTMQASSGIFIVGGVICLALWIIERKLAPAKVEADA